MCIRDSYYGVQAAMNRGGDVWKAYNRAFRDSTLGAQASDGSFAPNGFPDVYKRQPGIHECQLDAQVFMQPLLDGV